MGIVLQSNDVQELVDKTLRRFTAEKVFLVNSKLIPVSEVVGRKPVHLVAALDAAKDELVVSLTSYIYGLLDDRIKIYEEYPEDWWQAFKERWFPAWILRRYPVKYRVIDIDRKIYKAVCPHVNKPDNGSHFTWLASKDMETD